MKNGRIWQGVRYANPLAIKLYIFLILLIILFSSCKQDKNNIVQNGNKQNEQADSIEKETNDDISKKTQDIFEQFGFKTTEDENIQQENNRSLHDLTFRIKRQYDIENPKQILPIGDKNYSYVESNEIRARKIYDKLIEMYVGQGYEHRQIPQKSSTPDLNERLYLKINESPGYQISISVWYNELPNNCDIYISLSSVIIRYYLYPDFRLNNRKIIKESCFYNVNLSKLIDSDPFSLISMTEIDNEIEKGKLLNNKELLENWGLLDEPE